MARSAFLALLALALGAACALPPRLADPGRSGVWGYLRLVPHEGLAPPSAGAGSYGDRRYADVELVDYDSPGFAVVYLEGEPPAAPPLELVLRSGLAGLRLEPAHAALPAGGLVAVRNAGDEPRVVTCPAASVVRRLEPGESVSFRLPRAGAAEVFVPGAPRGGAVLFAAPGPFARVQRSGRYELLDVEAGARHLHAWHPRLPPTHRDVVLRPGAVQRLDLELGVSVSRGAAPASPDPSVLPGVRDAR